VNKPNSTITCLFVFAALFFVGLTCSNSSSNDTKTNSTGPSTTPVLSPPAAPKDISGTYEVTGTNANGAGNYKGALLVTPHDEVYQFSWNTAGKTYDGVGVQTDNAVAVAFTGGTNGKGCGVVLYKINSDGSLDGKAGYWGVDSSETETAKRTSGSGLEGEYDISGTNTGGKDYKGTLSVEEDGAGYTFTWNAGNTFEGFGIKQGNKVAVGLGGKQCGFVSYEIGSNGTLEGKWGGYGVKTFGMETATKKK
jgi:hypothetical protein